MRCDEEERGGVETGMEGQEANPDEIEDNDGSSVSFVQIHKVQNSG